MSRSARPFGEQDQLPVWSIEDRRIAIACLIAHLRPGGPPPEFPPPTAEQWEATAGEAIRYRLGPLAFKALTAGSHASGIPPAVRERLKAQYLANAFRNIVLSREVAGVARALAARSIPLMILKGQHLAFFEYREPALRTMADIDVMVPPARLAEAEAVLVAMGYGPNPRPEIATFTAWSNQLAKFEKDGAEVLELHYAIERPTSPFPIDTAALWGRAIEADLAGVPVKRLATEDLLIHLCLHLAYHHKFDRAGLKGLVDLAAVIDRGAGSIDWATLLDRSSKWGAQPFVGCSLQLAADLLGAPVPPAELARFEPDPTIVAAVKVFLLAPSVDLPAGLRPAGEGEPSRFSRLMASVFPPPPQLRAIYGLPAGSQRVWPYYLVRVGDLLIRRGKLVANILVGSSRVRPALDQYRQRDRISRLMDGITPGHGQR